MMQVNVGQAYLEYAAKHACQNEAFKQLLEGFSLMDGLMLKSVKAAKTATYTP